MGWRRVDVLRPHPRGAPDPRRARRRAGPPLLRVPGPRLRLRLDPAHRGHRQGPRCLRPQDHRVVPSPPGRVRPRRLGHPLAGRPRRARGSAHARGLGRARRHPLRPAGPRSGVGVLADEGRRRAPTWRPGRALQLGVPPAPGRRRQTRPERAGRGLGARPLRRGRHVAPGQHARGPLAPPLGQLPRRPGPPRLAPLPRRRRDPGGAPEGERLRRRLPRRAQVLQADREGVARPRGPGRRPRRG